MIQISQSSNIIKDSLWAEIFSRVPPLYGASEWELSYRRTLHGASIKTLFKKIKGKKNGQLTLIKSKEGMVFGLFSSGPWDSELLFKYYGNGETFLFKWSCPHFHKFENFSWQGNGPSKQDLLCTTNETLSVGPLESPALMISMNFYNGKSKSAPPFNNKRLHIQDCEECDKKEKDDEKNSSELNKGKRNSFGSSEKDSNDFIDFEKDFDIVELEVWNNIY